MVAYSFHKMFVEAVWTGQKRQTIRSHRKRHARVGERLKLYTGMRTRSCRLIRDDVRCTRIDEFRFDVSSMADVTAVPDTYAELRNMIDSRAFEITVNGMPMDRCCFNLFAFNDGFAHSHFDGKPDQPVSPFDNMVLFWMRYHGAAVFNGVMISWEPVA
jgi:hypothetical protein